MRITIIQPNSNSTEYWRNLWRYRELFQVLVWRDISIRYKQAILGFTWVLIQPLTTILVFTFVFGIIAQLPSDGNAPYALLVCCGILPWQLFSTAITNSSGSLVGNASLLSKVYFPRIIIPAAGIAVAAFDFLVSLTILVALLVYFGIYPKPQAFFTISASALLIVTFSFGFGLILASLNVRYRDIKYITPFILQVGLFISPVGFSVSVIPESLQLLYYMNPMVSVINGFRAAVIDGVEFNVTAFLVGLLVSVIALRVGLGHFKATEKSFADIV